jgi:hypothetical protein
LEESFVSRNKEHFLLWVLSGIIAEFTRDLYTLGAKLIGLSRLYSWEVAADIFIKSSQTQTFLGTLLGIIADFVTGGFLGVLFGLFIERSGTKYCLLKGLGTGLLAWIFLFGILYHALPLTEQTAPTDALSNFSAFISHTIFGLSMAYAYIKLAKLNRSPDLAKQKTPSSR